MTMSIGGTTTTTGTSIVTAARLTTVAATTTVATTIARQARYPDHPDGRGRGHPAKTPL
jgi:hypothetical protein